MGPIQALPMESYGHFFHKETWKFTSSYLPNIFSLFKYSAIQIIIIHTILQQLTLFRNICLSNNFQKSKPSNSMAFPFPVCTLTLAIALKNTLPIIFYFICPKPDVTECIDKIYHHTWPVKKLEMFSK